MSDELIRRKDAIEAIDAGYDGVAEDDYDYGLQDGMNRARYIIEDLPAAQPKIIRCKDCRWKYGAECVRFAEIRPFPDDFCSRAERRTDGTKI